MTITKALVDAVQRAANRAVEQRAASWILASVTVVNADGTVDLSTARGPVPGVRRLKSYSAPAVNDVVKVSRNSDGNWIVDGALA
ncbi:hypothetical protein AB0E81_11405 [Streptomyces sp. NPDC033538]|uniref:hypothetical protein n=1 Tax=Streptomyces sp. NPDC033538 TaxID=3155367 RepID=UPI0033C885B6